MAVEVGNTFKDMVETIIGGTIIAIIIISIIASIITIIGQWKAFKKANRPGWASIIPIYNMIVFLEIAELPLWYLALYIIPFVNIYAIFKSNIEFVKKYNLHPMYGVGLVFVPYIFWLIIGFGSSSYNK